MKEPSIPPRTRAELLSPAVPGGRHGQMIKIALALIGNGLSAEAVFSQLRGMYDRTSHDSEISNVIKWAMSKNPQPSGYGNVRRVNFLPPRPLPTVTAEGAAVAAERFLTGFRCDEADLWHASPWRPLEDPALDALPLLAGLFHGGELVNVCPEYGVGLTKTRDEWLVHVRNHGAPSASIGCFVQTESRFRHADR